MRLKPSFFLLCVFFLASCGSKSMKESITGKWWMHRVFNDSIEVTDEHNPKENRFILLNEDGTFESGGDPFGKNTGTWNFDEEKTMLHLYSDIEGDDSDWRIEWKKGEMVWWGFGDPGKERFKLIHKRAQE